jgi:hypothetical protein
MAFTLNKTINGDTVTFDLLLNADAANLDADAGVGSFSVTVGFDASVLSYVAGSGTIVTGISGLPNELGAATGTLVFGGFALPAFTNLDVPIVSFQATILDRTSPILGVTEDPRFGGLTSKFGAAQLSA